MNTSRSGVKDFSIQSLRAIAALFVVFDHTITQFNIYHHIDGLFGLFLRNVQGIGTVGVYIFFIVSGYIMSFTTFNKKWDKEESWAFLKKRALRIYPTYWVWLTLLLVVWFCGLALKQHDYSLTKIISSYTLFPYSDSTPNKINPVLGQGWTLIYEMFYYLFFTFLIFFNVKKNYAIFVSLVFFSAIIALGHISITGSPAFNFFMSSKLFYFFVLGMAICKYQLVLVDICRNKIFILIYFVVCVISLYILTISESMGEYRGAAMALLGLGLFLLLFVKGVKSKPLSVLGDASYSLYLSHSFVVMAYGVLCKSFNLSFPILFFAGIVTILISITIGLLSYFFIEKKLQLILNNKFMPSRNGGYI